MYKETDKSNLIFDPGERVVAGLACTALGNTFTKNFGESFFDNMPSEARFLGYGLIAYGVANMAVGLAGTAIKSYRWIRAKAE
jgi:hypothetical protein